MALDFGLLLADGAFTLAGSDSLVFPQSLNRAVRLDFVGPVSEHPWPTLPILPWLYLRMLNSWLHTQASGQPVQATFSRKHHSTPKAAGNLRGALPRRKPDIPDKSYLSY